MDPWIFHVGVVLTALVCAAWLVPSHGGSVDPSAMHRHPPPDDPSLVRAVAMIDRGDVTGLRSLLQEQPGLVHQRLAGGHEMYGKGYFKQATLLHFVAANPLFEGEKLPANLVEVAAAIIEAGAEVDAGCGENGQGTTLGLVASGRLVRENGQQAGLIRFLCEQGADPNLAIGAAMAEGEPDAVQVLLEAGADRTLEVCAYLDDWREVKRIVMSENPPELARRRALAYAAIGGGAHAVFYLCSADYGNTDPSAFNPEGIHAHCTAMHQAAWNNHTEVVKALLRAGADPQIKDKLWGGTPRDWAEHAGHTDLATMLGDAEGLASLVHAARFSDLDTLGRLLAENPEWLNAKLPIFDGRLIEDVCNLNHSRADVGRTIRFLIEKGADPNGGLAEDEDTPLHNAASAGKDESLGVEAIAALLDGGAGIDPVGHILGNGTPLVYAVIFRNVESARLLIERGASFDLTLAAGAGRLDLVKTFFDEHGGYRNPYGNMPHRDSTSDPAGELKMAMCVAAINGQQDCMAYLLERGAPLNPISVVGTTPLDEAINGGHESCAAWLRSLGAQTAEQVRNRSEP